MNIPASHPSAPGHLPSWKRALDLSLFVLALPLFATVAVVCALVIAIGSPGPLFYRQQRVGVGGRRFQLLKFRTMHVDAGSGAHQAHLAGLIQGDRPMHKLDSAGDPRMMPGGWWLRASGLDELPQIINVLRGEMSFVGPRPCIPYEYECYSPWQRGRVDCVPGLTGLWQVSGKNRTTFNEMVTLDIAYQRQRCLALDLAIIVRTPFALLGQISDARRARTAAPPASLPRVSPTVAIESPSPAVPTLT